jgi:chromosome segregation ATPase
MGSALRSYRTERGTRRGVWRDNRCVASVHAREFLDAAVALDERDSELADLLEAVDELATSARRIHERAVAVDAFLARVPGELAAVEREQAEAQELRSAAEGAVAEAEREVERFDGSHRRSDERRAHAERALEHAREAAADAAARIERVGSQSALLLDEERAARVEGVSLSDEAWATAAAVRATPRVSESGRTEPGGTLADLAAWGDRVQTALLVVRGGLVAERERLLREAGELAAATLGEPLPGASVASVRRRVEELR